MDNAFKPWHSKETAKKTLRYIKIKKSNENTKHGFQMEDPNYIGFQNYQPVTTKEILYSYTLLWQKEKKYKSMQLGMNYQYECAMNHTVVTEEQVNNIQSKIKVSNACF